MDQTPDCMFDKVWSSNTLKLNPEELFYKPTKTEIKKDIFKRIFSAGYKKKSLRDFNNLHFSENIRGVKWLNFPNDDTIKKIIQLNFN